MDVVKSVADAESLVAASAVVLVVVKGETRGDSGGEMVECWWKEWKLVEDVEGESKAGLAMM